MSHDDRRPSRSRARRLLHIGARHEWSPRHLSHYVDGDLNWLARRRLELHAEECPGCGLGIRALRSLVRLMHGAADRPSEPAPATVFDRVRAEAAQAQGSRILGATGWPKASLSSGRRPGTSRRSNG